jgi:pimeloyl-ACP methyl ester carboxylesterase
MRLVRLPDSGHTPHREHPEVVLGEIEGFLRDLSAEPAAPITF